MPKSVLAAYVLLVLALLCSAMAAFFSERHDAASAFVCALGAFSTGSFALAFAHRAGGAP